MIRNFRRSYGIDMSRFQGSVEDYPSLADFFVRPFDPGTVTLEPMADHLLCPADGRLSGIETVTSDQATQVKGMMYPLSELIGDNPDFSSGWHVATIYLSPSDYHRFHHPVNADVVRVRRMGGSRFPVNSMGTGAIPRLFVRNERVVIHYHIAGVPLYFVAVGATFVGGIHLTLPCPHSAKEGWLTMERPVRQLDELGRFDLGSTIVLLFPASLADPISLPPGHPVRVGTPLFTGPRISM